MYEQRSSYRFPLWDQTDGAMSAGLGSKLSKRPPRSPFSGRRSPSSGRRSPSSGAMPTRTTFVFCPACPLAETCSPGAWKRAGVWGWDEQEAREKLRHHLVMSGLHQCSEDDADYLIESVIWEVDEYTAPDPPAPKKARQVLQEVRQPDKQAPAPVQDVIAETIRQMTQQQQELDGGAAGSGSSAGFRPRLDSVWPREIRGLSSSSSSSSLRHHLRDRNRQYHHHHRCHRRHSFQAAVCKWRSGPLPRTTSRSRRSRSRSASTPSPGRFVLPRGR